MLAVLRGPRLEMRQRTEASAVGGAEAVRLQKSETVEAVCRRMRQFAEGHACPSMHDSEFSQMPVLTVLTKEEESGVSEDSLFLGLTDPHQINFLGPPRKQLSTLKLSKVHVIPKDLKERVHPIRLLLTGMGVEQRHRGGVSRAERCLRAPSLSCCTRSCSGRGVWDDTPTGAAATQLHGR